MEDSLKYRYVIKLFSTIVSGIVSAIIIAIVPQSLGPIAYGQFVYLQEFFTKIINFMDMGTSTAFFIKLSAKNQRKELILFYFLYSIFVLFSITLFIYLIDLNNYTNKILPNIPNEYIYFGLIFAFFTWITQLFIKISDAYAMTVSVELIKVIHKILSLVLLLYFVNQLYFDIISYYYYNYIVLISFILIIYILFIKKNILRRNMLLVKLNIKSLIKEFVEYSHPLFVVGIISLFTGIFDIWLLQTMSGNKEMAYYGFAYSLAAMCFLFTSALTPIITREFSVSYEQNNLVNMKKLFYRYIPMLYSIATYFAIFISVQSENVILVFANEEYRDAAIVLAIIALYPIHQTYGQLSGSVLYATGQTKLIRNIFLYTQPISLSLTFFFLYYLDLGAIGLAYKLIIAQFIGVTVQLYFNAKFLDLNIKYFLFHQFYSIVFFLILSILSTLFINFDSPIVSFLASGIIYTLFVIISTYIYPQVFGTTKKELKQYMEKFIKKVR